MRLAKKRKRKAVRAQLRFNRSKQKPQGNDAFSYYLNQKGQQVDRNLTSSQALKNIQEMIGQVRYSDYSSEFYSSEEDDKNQHAYFKKDEKFYSLPDNVQKAILTGMEKSKHSDFYYKLQHLNEKIVLYKKLFYGKIPSYQKSYMAKKVNEK